MSLTTSSKTSLGASGAARALSAGNDLQYNLEITFEESVYGKEAKLKIPRWESCTYSKGTGAKSATAVKTCPSCKGAGAESGCNRASLVSADPAASVRDPDASSRTLAQLPGPSTDLSGGARSPSTFRPASKPACVLRLSNEGEHGVNGGPAGDLYVAIAVKPHPVFQRKGQRY
jgi:molecular chaperone DnaJ